MRRAGSQSRVYPPLLAAALVAVGGVYTAAEYTLSSLLSARAIESLSWAAHTGTDLLRVSAPLEEVKASLDDFADRTGLRVTLITSDGRPLWDSALNASALPNQIDQPEVREAIAGQTGQSFRRTALGYEAYFVALAGQHDPEGRIVRVGQSREAARAAGAFAFQRLRWAAFGAAGFAAIALFLLVRRQAGRLARVQAYAAQLAEGASATTSVDRSLPVEYGGLVAAINRIATQLHERSSGQLAHTYELEAVLSSMVESVLAVNRGGRILKLNPAAAALFKVPLPAVEGRLLPEVIRNPNLQRFVERVLAQEGILEDGITLFDGEERFLQAHGAPLRNAAGASIGAVIVLHDVTRLRRLETARSEFVANVSHELRTPITSIIGYVETLQDGALDSPGDATRFLGIIARQAQRLNDLIEDLLALSQIERGTGENSIHRIVRPLGEAVRASVSECAGRAEKAGLDLTLDATEDAPVLMNAALLQQAIVNLIDNAIKYSEAGGTVAVWTRLQDDAITIGVRDDGCGIAKEHLPRLFERFYRVEEDRGRRRGGTGLGLAIVKHVVRAHDGQVAVESEPGRGSTFTITLPRCASARDLAPGCPEPSPVAIIQRGDPVS